MSIGSLRQVSPAGPSIVFQFDPEQCEITGGIGGWQEVARPRDLAGTEWLGAPLAKLVFDLWLDGGQNGTQDVNTWTTVEWALAQFYAWGSPLGVGKEPPVLQLNYGVFSGYRWVLNDVSVSETIRNRGGQRVQAKVTVSLLEYISLRTNAAAADTVRKSVIAAGPAVTQSPTQTSYTVASGDNLYTIAAKVLGNAQRWPDIATLNSIRDPNLIFAGTKLKIPAR